LWNINLDGNMVASTEAQRISHVTEEEDQEPTTITAIKTEPNVVCLGDLIENPFQDLDL
jgi:hypothetical protein